MSEEKELKAIGEELAKVAVESQMGAKQLRTLYNLAKTKPLPLVEAFIQRQISRVQGTKAWQLVLSLEKEYQDRKAEFLKILMYANMLYPYFERQAVLKFSAVIEQAAREICATMRCGYVGLDIHAERDRLETRVRVSGYRGDSRLLASSIERKAFEKDPTFRGRIWIDHVDRR